MKAVIHINHASHQKQHAEWMRQGLERHGVQVEFVKWNVPARADLAVVWAWRQRAVIDAARNSGTPILVMERAHLPPRMEWTSCGFNGIGRNATYARVDDGGARWRQHFSHLEQPWSVHDGHVLICGQVIGDAALWGCDFHRWAQEAADKARQLGRTVVYRPHPFSLKHGDTWCPAGAVFSRRSLAADLAGASLVVTYNSTAGVETVLGGVPTVTFNEAAMAYPVTTHSIGDEPICPARSGWAHALAWTSWRPEEICSGETWGHLKEVLP